MDSRDQSGQCYQNHTVQIGIPYTHKKGPSEDQSGHFLYVRKPLPFVSGQRTLSGHGRLLFSALQTVRLNEISPVPSPQAGSPIALGLVAETFD